MLVDFSTLLKNLDGMPLKTEKGEATLKAVAVESLMLMTDDDTRESGESKLARYDLASKINGGGNVEITPEESALIKKRIGLCYGPVVVGPAFKLLNG